jgi:hypothetical protein
MRKYVQTLALLAGVLMLPIQPASACCAVQPVVFSSAAIRGWIQLHRPDGEIVHVKTEHIVFVMSALNSGADKRAQAKLQLVNGFCDVRESVDEVMRLIGGDHVFLG